jgi:hypothetical protein
MDVSVFTSKAVKALVRLLGRDGLVIILILASPQWSVSIGTHPVLACGMVALAIVVYWYLTRVRLRR